eukprot:XP_017953310.1 PREDICTED: protein kinase C theta type-like [Xenopus tropicalis]
MKDQRRRNLKKQSKDSKVRARMRYVRKVNLEQVLLAQDTTTGQLVAIKIINKIDQNYHESYLTSEKSLLQAAWNCEFLTRAYAAFEDEEYVIFLMEYLAGGNLEDYLKQRRQLDINTIRFLAAEIICGLQFLHSRGFIHRDIKPANIILDSAGHAKIADFGLAIQTTNGTAQGCTGTPGYIAPEMSQNVEYNEAVDYYSLGVILFQMATGMDGYYVRHISNLECMQTLEPELKDIIIKLLCPDPAERTEYVQQIKDHPFFGPVNWEVLRAGRIYPPFTPTPPTGISRSLTYEELFDTEGDETVAVIPEERVGEFLFLCPEWQNTLSLHRH